MSNRFPNKKALRDLHEFVEESMNKPLDPEFVEDIAQASNLPAVVDRSYSPMLAKDIPAEMMQALPILGAILQHYPFVKEQDTDGNYLPEAVEHNMVSQAKLAGDLYILMNAAGLTKLGHSALEELMCLTPRMNKYLGIDDGKTKTIELERVRVSERDYSSTEGGDQEIKETFKATRKRKPAGKSRITRKRRINSR